MLADAVGRMSRMVGRPTSRREKWHRAVVLFIGLGLIVSIWLLSDTLIDLKLVGYPGVFVMSALGSGAMILPVPGLLFSCGLATLLNPLGVALLAGIGETIGEMSGYAVGFGGRSMIERRSFYQTAERWMQRRGTLALFVMSAIPNPVFDVVGIAAGATRFPLLRFLATVLIGKIIKGLLVAYTCYYGISHLPWVE